MSEQIKNPYEALVAFEENGIFKQKISTLDTTNLPENELLIRVHYSALNYKDALSASGHRGITKSYPFTPGIDAAGVVETSRSDRFHKGDKVVVTSYDLGMNTPGGFGQYISVPADWVIPLPRGLSLQDSMIIGTSGLTAAIGAEKIIRQNIKPGEGDVLVTGATGAVGSYGVALLSHQGYRVIAVTGKEDQADFLKNIGAAEVISRKEVMDIPDKPLLSSRWVAALDTVGGSMLDAVIRQTAHNGVVACCGNVAGNDISTSVLPFILRGISLMGIDSGIARMNDRLRIWNRLSTDWKPATMKHLYREVTLEGLPTEINKMLKGGQVGKVLVRVP